MQRDEESCGQELAGSAVIPEQFALLFEHVAVNLRDHAEWVGTLTLAARQEHDAMLAVAEGYEAISGEARSTAKLMRTLGALPSAPHPAEKWNRAKFEIWMKAKVELQRQLAQMLIEHAEQSERALKQMSAGSPLS